MNVFFKKILSKFCFMMSSVAILLSCGGQEITPPEIQVDRVILSDPMLSLVTGDQYQLTAEVYPSNATNLDLKWKSDDESIVTVSDGYVTAINPGMTYVTATSVDSGKSDRCRVTVTLAEISVTGVTLSDDSINMAVGDEYQLTANIVPSTASNKQVTWSSSNDYVATVVNGKVKAVKQGSATITVTTKDGGKTARCDVNVSSGLISVTGVTLSDDSINMAVGDEYQLTANIVPSTASNKQVTWSSSNDYVATVVNGKVKAVKQGSARITVTTHDGGHWAYCQVTVSAKEEPVEFDFSVSGSAGGYDYVDLGLSVKWATHNIGAKKMTDVGEYYAWGETTPYVENLTYKNYGWGFPPCSNDAILASIYDTATELWGRSWRMPTGKELKELINGCTWTWVDNMNNTSMSGYVATSKINGKSIFLPASKFISGTSSYKPKDNDAIYWSSYGYSVAGNINFGAGTTAECLKFATPGMINPVEMSNWAMGSGATIRPVVGTPNDFFPDPDDLTYDQAEMDRQGVSVSGKKGQHTYVDLGLPSRTLWATYNVGASYPEEYGDFFAWGETKPKDEYTMENYKFFSGYNPVGAKHYAQLTKYVWDKDFGKVDGKYVLENSDDAAYVNWGSNWHMPTIEQVEELGKYCEVWRADLDLGGGKTIIGYIVMSMINENFLYLPAAGWEYSQVPNNHMYAWYWTCEVSPEINTRATFMLEKGDEPYCAIMCDKIEGTGREQGLPVRAVTKK